MVDILWSEFTMPDGRVPGPDDVVVVDSDVRLIFDAAGSPAEIKGLVVYGEFTVEDGGADAAPLALTTDWAVVSGSGSFEIGTAQTPFAGKFDLTLAGKDNANTVDLRTYPDGCETAPDQCPVTGGSTCHCGDADGGHAHHVIENNNAFLMAMGDGATISIHTDDAQKEAWTQLDGTLQAGASTMTFTEATGWEVGDRIVVASTDFDPDQAEEFTIVAVSDGGRTVTLDRPATYMHYGEVDTYNDPDGDVHQLDMRAEVGLLSRDVTIQGDIDYDDSVPLNQQADQYGGHTMVMHGGEMYLSGVELAYMGQAGILGRYPAHWHESGDVAGQYISDSSIHHSFNKGITVHNTQGATVRDNVVFETISHNYYLEEADTYGNELLENLGINARHVGRFGEIGGAQDGSPSNFYTPNADNTWIGNHGAGSEDIGFYFRLEGDNRLEFGTVKDNTAHSVENRALYVHHRGMAQDGNPQGTAEQPQKAADWEISGLTVYKSSLGAYSQAANGTITDSVFAEMGSNARFRLNTTIEDSLIVGRSNNIGNPVTADEQAAGRSLPGGDGNFQGFQLYDGPGSLSNVMFDGFTEPGDGAIETSNAIHKSSSFGLDGITWGDDVAEANKINIGGGGNAYGNDNAARGLVDVDGSISGVVGAMIYMRSTDRTASEGFNAGAEYEIREGWGAIITTSGEQSATLTVDSGGTPARNTGGNHPLPFSSLGATRSDGEYANDIRQQIPVFDGFTYELNFGTPEQDNFRLYLGDADWGQSFIISLGDDIPATSSFIVDNPNNSASRPAREVSSMQSLEASPDTAVFRDADGVVHVKLVAEMAHGYLWPQPGTAMPGSLNSGVTVLVNTAADLDLSALVYDDPTPNDLLGPPPYAQGQAPEDIPPANSAPLAADDALDLEHGGSATVDVLANDIDPDDDMLEIVSVDAGDGLSAEIDGTSVLVSADPGFSGAATVSYDVSDGQGGIATAEIRVTVAEAPEEETPGAGGETVLAYQEQGGSLLIEAESLGALPPGWVTKADYDREAAPDLGALGGRNDFVMWQDADQSDAPGQAILTYHILIQNPGLYDFELRDQPATDNPEVGGDTWVKIDGAQFYGLDRDDDSRMYPEGAAPGSYPDDAEPLPVADGEDGWMRYQSTNRSTHWGGGGHVNDTGVRSERHDIVVEFDAPGLYTIQLAGATPSSHAIGAIGLVDRSVVSDFSLQGEPSPQVDVALPLEQEAPDEDAPSEVDEPSSTAPIAKDDAISMTAGNGRNVNVLRNDSDPNGPDEALEVIEVSASEGLSASIQDDGRVRIVADRLFSGEGTVTYTVSDEDGETDTAEVAVTVTPRANTAPEADDDRVQTIVGQRIQVNVDGNDTDAEDDRLAVTIVEEPANGSVEVLNNRDIRYTPDAGFVGTDTVTYQVDDGWGGTDTAVLTIDVRYPKVKADGPVYRANANGNFVFEAESAADEDGGWVFKEASDLPEGHDAPTGGYVEAVNVSFGEPLDAETQSSSFLTYNFVADRDGYVQIHLVSSYFGDNPTEHNDAWTGILKDGVPVPAVAQQVGNGTPKELEARGALGLYKTYQSGFDEDDFIVAGRNVDNLGVAIVVPVEAGEQYTFVLGERSDLFQVDRIVLEYREVGENVSNIPNGQTPNFAAAFQAEPLSPIVGDGPDTPATIVDFDEVYAQNGEDFGRAMQAAIDALEDTGGTILMSSEGNGPFGGTYSFTSSQTLRRTDEGDELPITVTTADGGMAVVTREVAATAINVSQSTALTFENIKITSDDALSGDGIGIFNSSDIGLNNVVVENAGGNGVHAIGSSDLSFEDVTILNSGVHGMRLSNIDGLVSTGLLIDGTETYGIGIQKNTLSTGIHFTDTTIRNTGQDGVDIKGQMVHTGEPHVRFDGISVTLDEGAAGKAALDLRGHVSVNNADITLEAASVGIRMRRGEAKDSEATDTNGSAGYGEITNSTVTSLSGGGTGIQISSGDTQVVDTEVVGITTGNSVHLINATNLDDPIRFEGLTVNGNLITDLETFEANHLRDDRPSDAAQQYRLIFADGTGDGSGDPDPVALILTLMDASEDAEIAQLTDGAEVTLTTEALADLSVTVSAESGSIGSVVFFLDGDEIRTENVPPFALFGDNSGDLNAGTIAPGAHALTVVAYSADNGSGDEIGRQTIAFEIVEEVPNTAPVAENDTLALDFGGTEQVDALENDTDADGDELTVTGVTAPEGLDASVLDDGATIEITAEDDFTGDAIVTYEISDGNGGTDTAEIAVTVAAPEPQNRAPEAKPDRLDIDLLGEANIDVLANDTDPDGDTLFITDVSASDGLSAEIDGDEIRVVAERSFTGSGTVVYDVEDGRGGTDSAEVSVTLRAPEPVDIVLELWDGRDDSLIGTLEDAAVFSLPAETLDALTITARSEGAPVESVAFALNDAEIAIENHPPYALFGNNRSDLAGAGLEPGRHSLTVTVYSDDGAGGVVLGTRTVAFDLAAEAPDELPIPATPAYTLTEGDDTALTIRADALGEDPEGLALVVSSVAEPEVGRVEIADDGSTLTYLPEPGFVGTLDLEVAFSEAGAAPGRATTTVTIEVAEAELAPPMLEAAFYTTNRLFDREIAPLIDGAVFDADAFSGAGEATIALFRAEGAPEIGSVQLVYGAHSRIENAEPYALFSNWGLNYFGGTSFEPGDHALEVTVFAEPDGNGAVLDSYTIDFEVVT
ncbi:MAG: Ig-like domain-containing protein [Pikeienuella sp.]